jgi:hypothetical protein
LLWGGFETSRDQRRSVYKPSRREVAYAEAGPKTAFRQISPEMFPSIPGRFQQFWGGRSDVTGVFHGINLPQADLRRLSLQCELGTSGP